MLPGESLGLSAGIEIVNIPRVERFYSKTANLHELFVWSKDCSTYGGGTFKIDHFSTSLLVPSSPFSSKPSASWATFLKCVPWGTLVTVTVRFGFPPGVGPFPVMTPRCVASDLPASPRFLRSKNFSSVVENDFIVRRPMDILLHSRTTSWVWSGTLHARTALPVGRKRL